MTKGIIFYTENKIEDPIKSLVQKYILESGLPIVSTSLEPIDFDTNIVVKGIRGYPTYVKQILTALEFSFTDYVFFCEHDVLYPKSHFDFMPPRDDIFYYNANEYRWLFGSNTVIRHDRMYSLSCLCVNRKLALDQYKRRLAAIEEMGLDKFQSREPDKARKWGYEPGVKKKKRGGFSDDDFGTWESEVPVIDIRHKGTFSPPKTKLSDFKHPPKWFEEIPVEQVMGWDLKGLFKCS